MKLRHLHVKNIRSYKDLDIDFCDGVTVISGANGSGKSSILEACFMALFGANALYGTDLQIADMICRGAATAEIVLDFDHMGSPYRIEQQFRVSKSGSAANTRSVLYRNGDVVADQSKKTYVAVKELLNMDEEAYENCAYIRQGEVDALINAKPKDRQKMIDDLLCLGKLEEYRERAAESRKAVSRLSRSEAEKFAALSERSDDLRQADLPGQLASFQTSRRKIDDYLASLDKQKEALSSELILIGERIRLFSEREKEKNDLERSLKELETEKMNAVRSREMLLSSLSLKESASADARIRMEALQKEVRVFLEKKSASDDGNSGGPLLGPPPVPDSLLPDPGSLFAAPFDGRLLLDAVRSAENRVREQKQAASEKRTAARRLKEEAEKTVSAYLLEAEDIRKQTDQMNQQILDADDQIRRRRDEIEACENRIRDRKDRFSALFRTLCPEASFSFLDQDAPLDPADAEAQNKWLSSIDELEAFVRSGLRAEEAAFSEERAVRASLKSEIAERKKAASDNEEELKSLLSAGEQISFEIGRMNADIGQTDKKKRDLLFLKTEREKEISSLMRDMPLGLDVSGTGAAGLDVLSDQLTRRRQSLEAEAASMKAKDGMLLRTIQKYEALIQAGKCPTCGQRVDEDHVPCHLQEEERQRGEIAVSLAENGVLLEKIASEIRTVEKIRTLERALEDISGAVRMTDAELSGKRAMAEKYKADLKENVRRTADLKALIEASAVAAGTAENMMAEKDRRLQEADRLLREKNEQAGLLSLLRKEISQNISAVRAAAADRGGLIRLRETKEKQIVASDERQRFLMQKINEAADNVSRLAADLDLLTKEEERSSLSLSEHENAGKAAEELVAVCSAAVLLWTEIDGIMASLSAASSSLEEKDRAILEKKDRLRVLSEYLGKEDAPALREKSAAINDNIRHLSLKAEEWQSKRSGLLEQIGDLQGEVRRWHMLEDDLKKTENRISYLSLVLEDVTALEAMYLRIRTELRSRNIRALDALLNDMFTFIYTNNAYSRIELDADYNLKVYEKNGVVLEPRLLSGGERALFNLALRCAVYRFLSFGFGERTSPGADLPPMILDEPTVFLDSGHIRQLIKLIDRMKDLGVGQIIVVSHDESLIDSADRVYLVTKDSLTNTSSFEEYGRGRGCRIESRREASGAGVSRPE